MATVPLADLPPGARAVLGPGLAGARTRLLDLGFVPGTVVHVVRRGPLGDPMELELRGYRICLRRHDLEGLCATPLEAQE